MYAYIKSKIEARRQAAREAEVLRVRRLVEDELDRRPNPTPYEVAQELDPCRVADNLQMSEVAYHICVSEIAYEMDKEDIAAYFDADDIARHLDIYEIQSNIAMDLDHSAIAEEVDITEIEGRVEQLVADAIESLTSGLVDEVIAELADRLGVDA